LLLRKAAYGDPVPTGIDTHTVSTLSMYTHTYQDERLTTDCHMMTYQRY